MRAAIPAALLMVCAAVAGCGSSGGTGGTSPSPTATATASASPSPTGSAAAFCAAADKLKTSVQSLTGLSTSSSLSDLQNALNNIETNLNDFAATGQSQFGPQIDAMKSALANLKSAITAAGASPNSSAVSAITAAAGGVLSAYTSLQQAVSAQCG
jgi:hypothetical protein